MKEDKYTKNLARNQVCAVFHILDIRENVLPKFTKLCMETPCWCFFEGHQYGGRKPTETSIFEFSFKGMNTSLSELVKIKVISILRQRIFRQQNLGKSVTFLNSHKSFPGRQLNAASRKSLEIR